jgi:thioredoxin-dependent peroxiredoxin
MADDTSSRLTPGTDAPDFTAKTVDGEEITLSRHRGGPVWLAFFRYAMCPLCNFRIHQLMQVWPKQFAPRRFTMLGVFQSPPRKLEGLVERHDPPFKVIADPDLELYTKYHLETKWAGAFGKDTRAAMKGASGAGIPLLKAWDGPANRVPADFLIDADGVIREVFYGENIAQHIPLEQVEGFLDAIGR